MAVVQKTKTMKKDSAFKLKSGNKPSVSKLMGISPTKKVLDQVKVVGKRAQGTDVTEEYKTKGNKATRDHIAKGGKVFKSDTGQIVLRKDAPSPASKKKFKGARSAAASQTGGAIIRRERLMI